MANASIMHFLTETPPTLIQVRELISPEFNQDKFESLYKYGYVVIKDHYAASKMRTLKALLLKYGQKLIDGDDAKKYHQNKWSVFDKRNLANNHTPSVDPFAQPNLFIQTRLNRLEDYHDNSILPRNEILMRQTIFDLKFIAESYLEGLVTSANKHFSGSNRDGIKKLDTNIYYRTILYPHLDHQYVGHQEHVDDNFLTLIDGQPGLIVKGETYSEMQANGDEIVMVVGQIGSLYLGEAVPAAPHKVIVSPDQGRDRISSIVGINLLGSNLSPRNIFGNKIVFKGQELESWEDYYRLKNI